VGEVIGLLLKPLGLVLALLIRLIGFSNEPRLVIAVNHYQLVPGEVDVTGIIVENVGYPRASATKRAKDLRVRSRVDADGPFDLYWEGVPPQLVTELLEDEPKGVDIAYRWPGVGEHEVAGVHLQSGVTYLADGALELQHMAGWVLTPGPHTLEVFCYYNESGRARARLTLFVPEVDDHASLLVLQPNK